MSDFCVILPLLIFHPRVSGVRQGDHLGFRVFKSIAVKADLDPNQISGHSTRIGAAQDLLDSGASIGQIMAKVGWSKVDTVMRYVGVKNVEAMNSSSTL